MMFRGELGWLASCDARGCGRNAEIRCGGWSELNAREAAAEVGWQIEARIDSRDLVIVDLCPRCARKPPPSAGRTVARLRPVGSFEGGG